MSLIINCLDQDNALLNYTVLADSRKDWRCRVQMMSLLDTIRGNGLAKYLYYTQYVCRLSNKWLPNGKFTEWHVDHDNQEKGRPHDICFVYWVWPIIPLFRRLVVKPFSSTEWEQWTAIQAYMTFPTNVTDQNVDLTSAIVFVIEKWLIIVHTSLAQDVWFHASTQRQ